MEIIVLDFGNTWFLKNGIKTTYMRLWVLCGFRYSSKCLPSIHKSFQSVSGAY